LDYLSVASTFLFLLVAELGDKMQLSVISLSSSYKSIHVLTGSMLVFLAVDGISIAVGEPLLTLVPARYVQIISSIIFILFGIVSLVRKEKRKNPGVDKRKNSTPLIDQLFPCGYYGTGRQNSNPNHDISISIRSNPRLDRYDLCLHRFNRSSCARRIKTHFLAFNEIDKDWHLSLIRCLRRSLNPEWAV
jgi:hypothetical protein